MAITWVVKKRDNSKERGDVRLILSKSRMRDSVRISFYDGVSAVFKGKYIVIGYDENRLYFRPTDDSSEGYALHGDRRASTFFTTTNYGVVQFAKKNKSLYKLHVNPEEAGTFYVDATEEVENG